MQRGASPVTCGTAERSFVIQSNLTLLSTGQTSPQWLLTTTSSEAPPNQPVLYIKSTTSL